MGGDGGFLANVLRPGEVLGRRTAHEHAAEPSWSGLGATIPEAHGDRGSSSGGIAQHTSGKQSEFGQPLTGLLFMDELASRPKHLLGREVEWFNPPATTPTKH